MQIRKITPAEKIAFDKLQSIAFVYPTNLEETQKQLAERPETIRCEHIWGCFDDAGVLRSGLYNTPYAMYYDGHVVGASGIGGVASLPETRMRGGVRAIFHEAFAEDRARGAVFSLLYPFSHPYYRQFGYELCHEARTMRFPMRLLSRFRFAGEAWMHEPGADDSRFRALYEAYAGRYTYAFARDEPAWKRVLHGDPYKAEAYRYVLSLDGQDVAYCMFRPHRGSDGVMNMLVYDFAYTSPTGLYALLGFLHRLSAQFRYVEIEVPDDLEIAALLDEPHDVQVHSLSRTMARVVDVEKALSLMRHPGGPGAYTLCVEDAFLPGNSGAYAVRFGADGVQVARTQDKACDMTLTVQALAQLCLGYIPLDMALLRQDVQCTGNEDVLRRVFVKKAKFLTDRF